MKHFLFFTAVSAIFLTASCNRGEQIPQQFNDSPDLATLGVTQERVAALDAVLQSFVDDLKVPCVTAFVAKGGNVVYEKSFGVKNIETQTPARINDIYVLFSQTKAIVAVALMTLYEKGLLDVEDPISKWIPDFPNEVLVEDIDGGFSTVPAERPVTVAHLLSHSSGYLAPLTNRYLRIKAEAGEEVWAPRTTVRENVSFNLRFPLGFHPGTDWNYYYDMEVIAYLIEIISRKPLSQYLQETVFDPLGMDATGFFFDDESLRPRFVTTYSKSEEAFVPSPMSNLDQLFNGPKTYVGGTLGLYGPIRDYARFCQMLLNGGEFNDHRILKPETILLMRQNRLPEENKGGPGFQFGLGFELFHGTPSRKDVPAMSDEVFRWGGAAGTEYIIDPENELIILYYISMWGKPAECYPVFLNAAYGLFDTK
jgi:CubicO group peptidase (beta-lactamase class C family)